MAIELDPEARSSIIAEQQRIRRALRDPDGLKWVGPDHLHLTLAFLGETDRSALTDLVEAVREPIDRAPFGLGFGGLGVFPPRGAPRVIWLGTSVGAADVAEVRRIVVNRLARAGAEVERRPFHAHLTLGRWRAARPSDVVRVLAANRPRQVAVIRVNRVALVHSRLSPGGPTYVKLAWGPLVGDGGPPVQ